MSNQHTNPLGFRNPLFRETVVIRSLLTLREITDELLKLLDRTTDKPLGVNGTVVLKALVDFKINEITDELTLDRINR